MKALLQCFGFTAALVSLAAAAQAGVVIEQEQRDLSGEVVMGRTVYYLEPGKVRIETSNEVSELVTIFIAARRVVWVIDRSEGTYYELKPAEVERMRQRMEEARRRMEAELAKLPPQQRELIEKMMEQQQPPGPSAVSVRKTGSGEKFGEFVCSRYEILRNGQRYGEVWAASLDQLQIEPEEFETFRALARFFEPLGAGAPASAALLSAGEQMEGFPVRMLIYEDGRPLREERVVRVERRSLDASHFTLPPGLQKAHWGQ